MENEQKWLQLSEVATKAGNLNLVQECLTRAQSFGSLILLASASSDKQLMSTIAEQSRKTEQFNIAFLSNFVLGKLDQCLEILIENQRLPEAAFFCRTYLPAQIGRIVGLWREKLQQMNMDRAAQALANPTDYENLFPGLVDSYKTEQYLKQQRKSNAARDFQTVVPNWERNPIGEMHEAEENEQFSYVPVQSNKNTGDNDDEDEDNFADANEVSKPIPSTTTQIKPTFVAPPPPSQPKPTTSNEASTISKLVPPSNSSDRSRSQSPNVPTKGSTPPPSQPPAPVKAATTTATATARKTSMSDLEKELEDFDIDLDKDDVSDVDIEPSTGVIKKPTDEDEVKTLTLRNKSSS